VHGESDTRDPPFSARFLANVGLSNVGFLALEIKAERIINDIFYTEIIGTLMIHS
jgi:hypothetical protein